MSNKSPIFPMHFGPQSNYLQVLEEEARKYKQERGGHHLKLQKPIFQDNCNIIRKKKSSRSKRWLKNAFRFFRSKLQKINGPDQLNNLGGRVYQVRASGGPIYKTESGGSTRISRSSLFLMRDNIIPYISLRDLNMDQQPRISAAPIYLVT